MSMSTYSQRQQLVQITTFIAFTQCFVGADSSNAMDLSKSSSVVAVGSTVDHLRSDAILKRLSKNVFAGAPQPSSVTRQTVSENISQSYDCGYWGCSQRGRRELSRLTCTRERKVVIQEDHTSIQTQCLVDLTNFFAHALLDDGDWASRTLDVIGEQSFQCAKAHAQRGCKDGHTSRSLSPSGDRARQGTPCRSKLFFPVHVTLFGKLTHATSRESPSDRPTARRVTSRRF